MSSTEQILNNYELIVNYSTFDIPRPLYLGNKTHRVCRFCGKNKNEVSFKKKAHVIPEGIGNKKLFSLYECDSCNSFFGNTIENDLNNLISPYKLFFKIKGKKGINTVKPFKGKDRIEYAQDLNIFLATLSKENIAIDDENKTAIIKIQTQPINLFSLYKCLLKIAILVLPENELYNFSPSVQLIKGEIITQDPLFVKISNTYPLGIEHFEVYLFRRKKGYSQNPYILFILMFRTFLFQINLHINHLDHNIKRIPLFYDSNFRNGRYGDDQIINCNNDLTARITYSFNLKYETSKKLPEELKKRLKKN
jgi:hypothetical protein